MTAAKLITFYRGFSGLGLLISNKGPYLAIANYSSSSIQNQILNFLPQKSNCTDLNKWHAISVTWFNKGENLSSCWSNGEKLTTFTGNVKGFGYCYMGDLGKMLDWEKYIGKVCSINFEPAAESP